MITTGVGETGVAPPRSVLQGGKDLLRAAPSQGNSLFVPGVKTCRQ
jgi:hypothetical protein